MYRLKLFIIGLLLILPALILASPSAVPAAGRLLGRGNSALVYARGEDSQTLDPAFAQDGESYKVISNIFEGLVRFKAGTTEIEPCLAESWRVSPDGREWTFFLRKNVRFHDGTQFNSEAVRFSIERQAPLQRQDHATYASFVFGMVDKIITPDPHTVRFILKFPYSPFLKNLAIPASAPVVSPTAVSLSGDKFSEKPVGTGPFCFDDWEKGKRITLRANPDYWGSPPECPELFFTVINNSRLRSLALKLGLADIIDGIKPADARFLKEKGIQVLPAPGLDINYLGFFTDKKPFDSVAVRKAVSMSIDRELIGSELFQGASVEANGPLPPGVLGYDQSTRPLPYDPASAKELLESSGYAGGLNIKIITYAGTRPYNPAGGEKLAAALKEDLSRTGITAEIIAYPWQQYKESLLKEEGDAFLYGWISDSGDPDNLLYTLFSSSQIESGLNTSRYHNNDLDLLLARGQLETDQGIREQIYRKAVNVVTHDAPAVFLNHSLSFSAVSLGVEGFIPHASGYILLYSVKKAQKANATL